MGPERFAIIAVDCGKPQARARVADFYGNILLEPFSFEISAPGLRAACGSIRESLRRNDIQDSVAAIETTGRYHRPVKKTFQQQNWEPRDVHPFTSNLFRRAADESNKTDDTDLAAIHRAAVDGLAMRPEVVDLKSQQWRVLTRHRRDLVEKAAALKVQLKEAIHAYLPGYASLWHSESFWRSVIPPTIAVAFDSPAAVQQAGEDQFRQAAKQAGAAIRVDTIRRIRSWSRQAAPADDAAPAFHRRALDLWSDLQSKQREICEIELDLGDFLCESPGLLLLAFPGVNVVTASDYAAELGPLTNYANSKSIAGRAGLYPSRYQTSDTDLANGPLSARRNRQLRGALMRMARNLNLSNDYFMAQAQAYQRRHEKASGKVVIARSFSRLSYYLLAKEELFAHPAIQDGEKILQKLLQFYQQHDAESERVTRALDAAIGRLQRDVLHRQRDAWANANQQNQPKRQTRGVRRLGEILPAVLLRIDQRLEETKSAQSDHSEPSNLVIEDAAHGS